MTIGMPISADANRLEWRHSADQSNPRNRDAQLARDTLFWNAQDAISRTREDGVTAGIDALALRVMPAIDFHDSRCLRRATARWRELLGSQYCGAAE